MNAAREPVQNGGARIRMRFERIKHLACCTSAVNGNGATTGASASLKHAAENRTLFALMSAELVPSVESNLPNESRTGNKLLE